MPETGEPSATLDNLIDRIQKDGIEKAEQESAERVAAAERQAEEIVSSAEKKARTIVANAEKEGAQFEERARRSLAQAARDTLLSVSQAVDILFQELAQRSARQSMQPDALRELISDVIHRYFSKPDAQHDVHILVTKEDANAIGKQLMSEFGEAAKQGITLGEDNDLTGGFRISLKDQHLYHDLSVETIARLLCTFLRPQLAEITRETLQTMQKEQGATKTRD